jgi:hypothetical protein
MKVKGRTSGKWQDCSLISANGEMRFQVTGACGSKRFDLTWRQLMECTTELDLMSCTSEEMNRLVEEIKWNREGHNEKSN